VRTVQQWLQEVAALRALPEPAAGVPRARVHAAPAGGGAAYDAWYSTILYFSSCGSQSDVPGGVRMLAQRMPAEEHVAADVVAIARALGIGLLPYPACWMYIADTNEQPREEADGSQLVVVEVVPGGALQRGRYVMSEPQRRMSDLTPQAGDTVFLTSFIPARGVPFRIRAAVTKDQKSFRTILDDVGRLNAGDKVTKASPAPPPGAKAARLAFQARVKVARRAAAVAEVATPAALRGAALEHCQALAGSTTCTAAALIQTKTKAPTRLAASTSSQPCTPRTRTTSSRGACGCTGLRTASRAGSLRLRLTRSPPCSACSTDEVAELLTRGLLARVPPPLPKKRSAVAAADSEDDDDDVCAQPRGERPSRAARATLGREVDAFVGEFVTLLACRFLATPVNAALRTPLQLIPQRSVSSAARGALLVDYHSPVALLRVRMRAHQDAMTASADAQARVPAAWWAVTVALCVAMAALLFFVTWQGYALMVAALLHRLPVALPSIVRHAVYAAAALGAAATVRQLLASLAGAFLGAPGLREALPALHRASFLAGARLARWPVPLLRDAAAAEAHCAAQMRAWTRRALLADMRAAVSRRRIGGRRAAAIMAAMADAAEHAPPPADEAGCTGEYRAFPGSVDEAEEFLLLPVYDDADDEQQALGLCGMGDLIQGALEGDARAAMTAALAPPPPPQPRRKMNKRAKPKFEHTAAPAAAAAAPAASKRAMKRQRARAAAAGAAACEGLLDDQDGSESDGDVEGEEEVEQATAPPPTPEAAPQQAERGRDRAGWRTVETLLSQGGWRFVRCSGHLRFRRAVTVPGDGSVVPQAFTMASTPSDVRAGRHAAATLRRLNRAVA
jgi:hypothetical protein